MNASQVRLEDYASGGKAKVVIMGDVKLYFSYETLVGIDDGKELKVIQNHWNNTTGKHLNAIDGGDKASRLSPDEFEQTLIPEEIRELFYF